ncbi:MAG: hypothetical protein ACM3NN_12475 [Nitrospirota bacterium]|jgi:hypothetical protein
MSSIYIISLTPDFSRVFRATRTMKPFQRFFLMREAVKTAGHPLGKQSTWLKPDVNVGRSFLRSEAV